MGRSRMSWALRVAAPWCAALAVLLSITAEAEQEPAGYTRVFARVGLMGLGRPIIADRPLRAVDEDGQPLPLVEARLVAGDRDGGLADSGEGEPNAALKRPGPTFPAVDRAAVGDRALPTQRRPDATQSCGLRASERRIRSRPYDESAGPRRRRAGAPAPLAFGDGATPPLPLEFALNSSSPTSSDGVVVAVEMDGPGVTMVPQLSAADGKPNYAALIDPKDRARQMRCLAEAIYFESRSEPEEGQAAVAQVVLNRVRSGLYPTTVCGVVYQDRNRPFACQFSFACEGKSLRIEEPGPWAVATRIAEAVVSGASYNPKIDVAVNYHANYVSPFWAGYLKRVDRIGAHIFYAMRDGVNWAPGALNGRGDLPPLAN